MQHADVQPLRSQHGELVLDELLKDRLQDRPDPVTEMELLGMYEMITEDVLLVGLPI